MDIAVYSMAGQVIDHIAVDESALGGRPNRTLIREAIVMYEANRRVGTAAAKTRHQVSGSGQKPWRQKHTGRARHGTRTSPLWVGGGVTHGPKPRDFRKMMTKTARRRALHSAFLAKALDGQVLVLDRLELPRMKTGEVAKVLKNLGVERTFLIVLQQGSPDLWRCTRNIQGAAMMTCGDLNAYEMIRPHRVIFLLGAIQDFLADASGAQESEQPAAEEVGVGEDG